MYRTAQPLVTVQISECRSAIDNIFRLYNKAGLTVTINKADNEFKPLFKDLEDELGIELNCPSAQEHVPEAECNNHTIKERYCSHKQRLPFGGIPKVMIRYLVMESARKLNFFPSKGSVSQYFSPRAILHQVPLDYTKQFRYEFGQYVQAHDDNVVPKNTPKQCTIDCIYLRPTSHI